MYISLNIYGNKESNVGFFQILTVGDNHPLPDESQPGFEGNKEYYIIQNDARGTTFTVVPTHVSSQDGMRLGSLRIAITLPAGTAIAGGVSPYVVLNEIYALYVQRCMVEGFGSLKYNGLSPDHAEFSAVLAKYPLVAAPGPSRPMSGATAACVVADAARTEQLFADPQYVEFMSCSKVYVAASNGSQLPVLSVVIPRQRLYTVYLNGRQLGQVDPLCNPSFFVTESAGRYDEGINCEINFLQAAQGGIPGVEVSHVDETIRCRLQKQPKRYTGRIAVVQKTAADLAPGQVAPAMLYLEADGKRKDVAPDGLVHLLGEEVKARWRVKCADRRYALTAGNVVPQSDGTILWEVSVKLRAQASAGATAGRIAAGRRAPGGAMGKGRSASAPQWRRYLPYAGAGLLVLAVAVGLFVFQPWKDETFQSAYVEPGVVRKGPADNTGGEKYEAPEEPEPARQAYDRMLKRFEATDFAFAELGDFESKLHDDAEIQQCDQEGGGALKKRIDNYRRLKRCLDNLDLTTIKSSCDGSKYAPAQSALLLEYCGFYDGKTKAIVAASKGKMNSFADIQGVVDECRNPGQKASAGTAAPSAPKADKAADKSKSSSKAPKSSGKQEKKIEKEREREERRNLF